MPDQGACERDGAVATVAIDRLQALDALNLRRLAESGVTRAAIGAGADLDLDNGCRYESGASAVRFGIEDRSQGMRALLEERTATFSGK